MKIGGRKGVAVILTGTFLVIGFIFIVYFLFRSKFNADTVSLAPLAPSEITASDNAEKTAITLRWQDAAINETGYRIERSISVWREFEVIATVPAGTTTYTDASDFVTGQRYYYRIAAFNDAGNSVFSKTTTPTREELKDYLAGIGEFETSFSTAQQRAEKVGDAEKTYTSETVDSASENAVASAWGAYTATNMVPEQDYFFRLAEEGLNGTKQQCFGIKSNDNTESRALLRTYLTAGKQIAASEYANGDTVRFVVDKLSYIDANGLPTGSTRNFTVTVSANLTENGSSLGYHVLPGSPVLNNLPSNIDAEYALTVSDHPNAVISGFMFVFEIGTTGSSNLGSKTPGICMDGAHFYIKKASVGEYTKVIVPARGDHLVNSYLSHGLSNTDNPYYIAANYDHVNMAYGVDYLRLPAKYYNPNLKFYIYVARSFSDYRVGDTANEADPLDSTYLAECRINWLLVNHPEWFIPYDPTKLIPPSGDNRLSPYKKLKPDGTSLDYVFDDYYQTEYMADITNQEYITWWKTEIVKMATKRGMDGVFLDVSAQRSETYKKINPADSCPAGTTPVSVSGEERCMVYNATVAQSRDLLKQVVPYIKDNGLMVTMNCSGCYLNQADKGNIFFDPNNVSVGNTAHNTPDSIFQEHSFLSQYSRKGILNANKYRGITDWNAPITDMEQFEELNQSLPESEKKLYYVFSDGFNKIEADSSGNSADPLDITLSETDLLDLNKYNTGWANQMIASYLLGANKYSYLSIIYNDWDAVNEKNKIKEYPLDSAKLDKLGEPAAKRLVQYQGESYQFEDAALDSDSYNKKRAVNYREFTKGLVVDNADPDEAHNFVMPGDYTDEYGRTYLSGATITLQKRTGRIFYSVLHQPVISIQSPSEGESVLDTSVVVNYTVDGVEKTKTFDNLGLGENNLEIVEQNQIDPTIIASAKVKVIRKEAFALAKSNFHSGWNMVAFPSSARGIISSYLASTFRIRKYNQTVNNYDRLEGTGTSLVSGTGYWLNIDDTNKIDNFKYEATGASSVSVLVNRGWNMLGNPFDSNLPLSNLSVKYKDGAVRSYSDAVSRKEVAGYVWSYESTVSPKQYYFVAIEPDKYKTTAHKQTYISPFRGFWMIAKSDQVSEIIMNK